MKITSLQENFKNGLLSVNHIAGKNINLPILSNVKIKAKEGNIKLITTDLEIGITANIRGKIEKEGTYTVNSKTLSDFISLLPNKIINIEKKENKLLIKSENYKTIIKGEEAEEFPLIPQIKKEEFYKIKIKDFKESLSQIIFAVSNSETKIELSGVLFDFDKDFLTMVATDSFRLAEKKIKIINKIEQKQKQIIIPAKTLQEVNRILLSQLENEKNEIIIYVSDNQILFIINSIEIVSRLIEGQYPDYKQIIPEKSKTKIIVNKNELIRAVKVASIFSKSEINDINLDFPAGKNNLIITSTSGMIGENTTELKTTTTGDDNGVVVNFKFLLDGLNNINSDNVKIEVINNSTPCILKSENNNDYLYIIMPIRQ